MTVLFFIAGFFGAMLIHEMWRISKARRYQKKALEDAVRREKQRRICKPDSGNLWGNSENK